MSSESWKQEIEPFEVSEKLLQEVRRDPITLDEMEGYQGHPITGVGDVHTPPELVKFLLDQIGYDSSQPIEQIRIADLSCGTGSFVVEIVRRLRDRLVTLGYSPEDPDGARHIISTVKNNIVALDIESKAVWRTAQLVLQELQEEINCLPEDNPVQSLPIYHTNTLMPNLELDEKLFHRIVGNPPYIKNKDIDPEHDKIYRREYKTAKGKYDIYPLFFEKGLKLLIPNGKIGFVTPDRFHRTEYGKPLRELLLSQTRIELIVNLKDDPFPVVNAYPSLSVAKRANTDFPRYQYDNDIIYCEMSSEDLADYSGVQIVNDHVEVCSEYRQSDLDGESWKFIQPKYLSLKNDLESSMKQFSDLPIEIRAGVATGADDIFILSEKDAKRMEGELIYPVIRGKNVQKGHLDDLQYLLNPYKENGDAIELSQYPQVKSYLEHFRKKLEQRYCVREAGKDWYETHDTIDMQKEIRSRIVTPDVANGARFAAASGEICHNSCYSIHYHGDLTVLTAILNSSVSEFLLKSTLPKLDDGYWRQMKRDMKSLPVLDPYQLSDNESESLKTAFESKNWSEIDSIIFELLGLEDSDIELINEFLT